jgi:hypothetical protein
MRTLPSPLSITEAAATVSSVQDIWRRMRLVGGHTREQCDHDRRLQRGLVHITELSTSRHGLAFPRCRAEQMGCECRGRHPFTEKLEVGFIVRNRE